MTKYNYIRVDEFKQTGPHSLLLKFNDGSSREIDFLPALKLFRGNFFKPLLAPGYFKQVRLNTECGVIEWPNEADFSTESLRDWPQFMAWLKNDYPREAAAAQADVAALSVAPVPA